jgi:type IV pilus assembly protein PilC
MTTFAFTARDENGNPHSGMITAASVVEVGQMLRAEGRYPITVRPTADAGDGGGSTTTADGAAGTSASGVKISRLDVIQFSTQLAIMVETGVRLTEALDCIAQQATKPQVKQLVSDLSTVVQGGTDLSTALSRHPRSFPQLYVALIRASEKSGLLAKLLRRATEYLRDEHETIRRVRGALTYPAIMLAFAVTTTIFLLAFVLPRFTGIYANKGAALPAPTRVLMSMSSFIVGYWPALLVGIAAVSSGVIFYIRTRSGRRVWHTVQLAVPVLGPMFRKLHLARAMRMIGTMAGSGITLVECVRTAHELCGNELFRDMWSDVSEKIQHGKPMADSLAASTLVPRSVAQMIHSGEKGGRLAHVMEQVALFSEQELKEKIADLTRYIEPAMIVIMGAIIGGVTLALMLPIFTISRVVAH